MTIRLFALESYVSAAPEIKAAVINGCGAEGWKGQLVPETIWGLRVTAACNIHDWMYVAGLTLADKDAADRVFLNNLLRLINGAKGPGWLRRLRRLSARTYYIAVRDFGGPAFWDSKNEIENTISAVAALEVT